MAKLSYVDFLGAPARCRNNSERERRTDVRAPRLVGGPRVEIAEDRDSQGIVFATTVTHSYMTTKNPAPIPIANSVSNMIDPPQAPPRRDALSVSIWATSWLARRVPPFRVAGTLPQTDTLFGPGPSTMERTWRATAMIRRSSSPSKQNCAA